MREILENPAAIAALMRDVADAEILPRFKRLGDADIHEKAPGDLVTAADHASEAVLRAKLPELLAGSLVVGEEGYAESPDILRFLAGNAPVWIVDPVDGTFNFAHGKQPFTVIVALVSEGVTHAGWILDPMTQETLWAVRGQGTFLANDDGRETVVRRERSSNQAPGIMAAGAKLRQRLERASETEKLPLPNFVQRYRCVGREYMDIALGKLDFSRYGGNLKPWDHAAGCLIVREAGGRADEAATSAPYEPTPILSQGNVAVAGVAADWPTLGRLVAAAER